jgi:hypothetical protein
LSSTLSFQVTVTLGTDIMPGVASQPGASSPAVTGSSAGDNAAATSTASAAGDGVTYSLQQQYTFEGLAYLANPDVTTSLLSTAGNNAKHNS